VGGKTKRGRVLGTRKKFYKVVPQIAEHSKVEEDEEGDKYGRRPFGGGEVALNRCKYWMGTATAMEKKVRGTVLGGSHISERGRPKARG